MKKNGYQYKVSEDKKSILVPSNVRDDMRIFVAENDLIKNIALLTCKIKQCVIE